ncbi:glycosyltransferase [Phyllobacterium sp. P30BS-XVII]|uniref:glycosyltransferase n=1 Tax=Phyllobacterium sp. P30BS-XVII TaxID=2587046 RepID=UPI0015F8BB0D|nr:glycosyltransferase [Phyllobacterium sp. P30BS-XVII]MBA8900229.1 glycosyltransferase involved in cell wall biosynthesis [Phyllobacterium sp. P30BS-XVII]
MTVSIIMKTLNEEKRIAAAIESALRALPDGKVEIIVADSGSTDRTVEIAMQYPVIVAQIVNPAQPSCGIGPQLGFQYSHHDLICLMDGDMLLDKDFLTEAIAFLEANPKVAGVTGHVAEMNVDNLEFTRRVRRASPENRIGSIDRMNGGGLYRRKAIEQAGYFSDRNLHGYEEFDLGVRLRALGWELYRLDRRFVEHFGHSINAYKLLVRRWQSKYLRGVGELLRAALGRPHWSKLVQELPELRLWAGVYVWLLLMIALLIFLPDKKLALLIDVALIVLVVAAMSLKQRSLSLGFYAVVAWFFHAAALPLGFFHPRRQPDDWIESQVISKDP